MYCKDCRCWKKIDDDKGLCSSIFTADATPPSYIKSKKNTEEWLASDAWMDEAKATDPACIHCTNISYFL